MHAAAWGSAQAARSSDSRRAGVLLWALLCVLLLSGCGPREVVVASVNGVPVVETEVEIELRDMQWRRGEAWDALGEATRKVRRQEALDRCVGRRLVAGISKKPVEMTA